MTGSRLLMRSKNSEVCLAGVEGIRNSGVRLITPCLLVSSGKDSKEFMEQISTTSSCFEGGSESSVIDDSITSIGSIHRTIGFDDNMNFWDRDCHEC